MPNYLYSFCILYNMEKELWKDKNWLTEQYWGFNLSLRKMNEIVGIKDHGYTITKWMLIHEIPRRQERENTNEGIERLHDQNWLTEQYWGFELSQDEIADILGCSRSNVALGMQEFNIPTREKTLQPYHFPEWLIEQYYDEKISSHTNDKLDYWMRQYNLPLELNRLSLTYRDKKGRKFCYICEQWLNENCFNKCKKESDGLKQGCKKCTKKHGLERREKNRIIALQIYSDGYMNCSLCGKDDIDCLSFDHIEGGGNKHIKKDKIKGQLYRWLKRNNYPDGFRVLCHNCNHKERMRLSDNKIAEEKKQQAIKKIPKNIIEEDIIDVPFKKIEETPKRGKRSAYMKRHRSRPEVKAHIKEQGKEYRSRPEVKAHKKEYGTKYEQRPEVKARRKEQKKKYCQTNKEHERIKHKHWRYRVMALQVYSNGYMNCSLCGEDNIDCLAIDHINGNGGKHRKKDIKAKNFALWLSSNNYPDGYRILCHNCNHKECLSTIE